MTLAKRRDSLSALDQRVTIQTPSYASSTQSGQGVASFSTLATVWASVRSVSGDEQLVAGSITSRATYEIAIRHRSDVTPAMRVQWTPYSGSAKTFEVLAVREGDRLADRLFLECGVVE